MGTYRRNNRGCCQLLKREKLLATQTIRAYGKTNSKPMREDQAEHKRLPGSPGCVLGCD
ncbi:hypothetical protein BU16DRAFT_523392 [Lophium mytilinum]|uniref:Uncharacterized protein n=1 Tax=Lophium mytilinum TaxID=390894 RepID=A0A6A6R7S3_9PEZI|nr:hypothetical protein BU16DRAFT_523392 [Lophium mytilinum]